MALDNDDLAARILRRQGSLEARRYNWEPLWSQAAEVCFPRANIFMRQGPITEGEPRTQKLYDATAELANQRFASALVSLLCPQTQRWHGLAPDDLDLVEDHDVRVYLDQVRDILFAARYSPKANFSNQMHEVFMSQGVFGNGPLFIDDEIGDHIRYRAIHLSETYVAENHVGIIDTLHRKFSLTARQAVQRFGAEKLGDKLRNAAEKTPDLEYEFIHCVYPREEVDTIRADYRAMRFASYYLSIEDRKIVSEGGYRTWPYPFGRYVTGPREVYGRGPALTMLPDIKMLQEERKTLIRAAQKVVDPPVLLLEDGALSGFDMRSSALNYGGLDEQMRPTAVPFETRGRIDIGLEMLQEDRKIISDAFLADLWRTLTEHPDMTATQSLLIAQERGILLAPGLGRQQSEVLGPTIERELDILAHAGLLPPMPSALMEREGRIRIEYTAPLNRLQRAEDGVAINNTIQAILPLAEHNPAVLDMFDDEATVRELAEVYGVPAKVMRTPEMVAEVRAQRAKAQQAQMLMQAAPVAGKTMKDVAGAASAMAQIPQRQPTQ